MHVPIPLAPRTVRWLGVAAVAAVIFYFSIVVTVPAPPPDEGVSLASFWDKYLHFAAYAAFAYALAYATAGTATDNRRRLALVLGTAVAYGVAIELVQGPLPERYFSYGDMLANAVGALLVLAWFALESRIEYVPIEPP